MTQSKHTPGPWVACAGDDCTELQRRDGSRGYFPHVHIGPDDHGWTYVGSDGRESAGAPSSITINDVSNRLPRGHGTMAELDANARLIAAAPEMLEALRATRDFIAANQIGPAQRKLLVGWLSDAIDSATAIRKATGGEG